MKYKIELEGKELKDLYVLVNTLRKVMKVCIKKDLPLDHAFFDNGDNKLTVTKEKKPILPEFDTSKKRIEEIIKSFVSK